ncbi:MAG TPA: hypothetical protein VMR31_18185 [Myxococcota bacterium]|nr:hypothetical protein [Myxococcota bacterium]
MKHLAALALAAALLAPAHARAAAENSTEIAAETQRNLQEGSSRVANFWWLPPEYWILVAKELELPAAEQEKVQKIFRDYLIVAAVDVGVADKKAAPSMASIAQITSRCKFTRDGQTLDVLHEVNPEVQKLVPTLVYLLRTSLGPLGEGLRLLPLANLDTKGNPVLSASTPGELELQFRFSDDGPVHDVRWHMPLTSVVGVRKCPKGGEPLEASWTYCPWHGVKLEPKP